MITPTKNFAGNRAHLNIRENYTQLVQTTGEGRLNDRALTKTN